MRLTALLSTCLTLSSDGNRVRVVGSRDHAERQNAQADQADSIALGLHLDPGRPVVADPFRTFAAFLLAFSPEAGWQAAAATHGISLRSERHIDRPLISQFADVLIADGAALPRELFQYRGGSRIVLSDISSDDVPPSSFTDVGEASSKVSEETLTQLSDEEAYNAKLEEARQDDRKVVIKFAAGYCRACKAMGPKYKRMARANPRIEFCEISYETNKKFFKSLDVVALPYIEVIDGTRGKVEGFSCKANKISQLEQLLCSNIARSDSISDIDDSTDCEFAEFSQQ